MRLFRRIAAAAASLALGALPCAAAPGDRDLSFARTGGTRIGFGVGSGRALAMTQELSGRQLLAGSAFDGNHYGMAVMAYANGAPDPAFGRDGRLVVGQSFFGQLGVQYTSSATAIRVYDANRFVVAGYHGDFLAGWDFLIARFRNDGTPDSTFGFAGFEDTDVTGNADQAKAVAIQQDGKIVVAGTVRPGGGPAQIAVVRYNADGSLDNTFHFDGIAIVPLSGLENSADAIAIDSFGRIVVAGAKLISGNSWNMLLVRFTTTGTLDNTFHGDGLLEADTTNGFEVARTLWIQRGPNVLDPDKLVFAGESATSVAVLRYLDDGSPDLTFDTDGRNFVSVGLNPQVGGLLVQTNVMGNPSAFYVSGSTQTGMGQTVFYVLKFAPTGAPDLTFDGDGIGMAPTPSGLSYGLTLTAGGRPTLAGWSTGPLGERFTLVRFEATGVPDPTLDGDGVRTDEIGNSETQLNAMVVQSDDKLVAVGRAASGGSPSAGWAVLRVREDGEPDSTFSGDGRTVIPFLSDADFATAVAVQGDGKIVVAGAVYPTPSSPVVGVMRLLPNGDPDPTFDGDGKRTVSVQQIARASAVHVQADGRILVGGWTSDGRNEDFLLVRLHVPGGLDTSLDGDGIWTLDLGSVYDEANAIEVLPDGRILLAGLAHNGVDTDLAMTRCFPDGAIDYSFQSIGRVRTHLGGADEAYDVDLLPGGRILAGGSSVSGLSQYALVRYVEDGELDTSFDGDGIVLTGIIDSPGRLDRTAELPGGWRTPSAPSAILDSQGRAVVVQPNEKLLMVGRASNNMGPGVVVVARYHADGVLDNTYGFGYAFVWMDGVHDELPKSAALDSQNRLVIASNSSGLFGFARLLGDPPGMVSAPLPTNPGGRLALAGANPFRDATNFVVELSRGGELSLDVFDVGGSRVRTLARGHHDAGRFRVEWDGADDGAAVLAPGVYFARLQVGGDIQVAKLVKIE